MKNFLPHHTPLQSSQAPQTLSQEVGTTMLGRNTKVLRKLEGMLRKECRATLCAIGLFWPQRPSHLKNASLNKSLILSILAWSLYVFPPSFGIKAEGLSPSPSSPRFYFPEQASLKYPGNFYATLIYTPHHPQTQIPISLALYTVETPFLCKCNSFSC